jgi:hypothetical protein
MSARLAADDGQVTPHRILSGLHRGRALTLLLGALLAALLLLPAAAGAVVVEPEAGGVKVGLQPREMAHYWAGYTKWDGLGDGKTELNAPLASFNNHPGHPGPVLHSLATYAIYWDPQDYYHGDWQGVIDGFMANLGAAGGQLSNVFAVDAQYTDQTNVPAASRSSFRGAYTDTNPYPQSEGCTDPHKLKFGIPLLESGETVCITDKQIRAQLNTFIGEQHGLQKGMGTTFYVLTPPGVTVCLGAGGPAGHCSDFNGTFTEISGYEEEKNSYPERKAKYPEEKTKYEEEKKKYEEEKKEEFKKTPPVEPKEPTLPDGYADYTKSFCSYHSDISPTNPEGGDGNTILYAVIPWTAGEQGDYHILPSERMPGSDCQDGGFQPSSKPQNELQEKEHEKTRTPKEEEEFALKSTKEKREIEEARELGLEKPHDQEPSQIGLGPDGSYDTGLADLIVNQIAVEQQNTITDPLLNAWQDAARSEVTDECRNSFFPTGGSASASSPLTAAGALANQSLGAGHYYLNDAFNAAALRLPYPGVPCMNNISLAPKFTAPSPVNSGEVVGFDGMESDVTLDAAIGFTPSGATKANYATYTWNFGDGSPTVSGYAPGAPAQNSPASSPCAAPWLTPCAASAFHSYAYGGTYEVTLTITDVGGNTAATAQKITVVGPLPPLPPPPPPPAPPAPGTPGGPPLPLPAATAVEVPQASTPKQVARRGLVVHYTVSEQVTGHFEVLMEAAAAHRLGITGPLATGLPAGSPAEIVVGHALLTTLKGGSGAVRIKLSKSAAKHLKRAHKATLTVRMVVRNASASGPQFTTVVSAVELHS